MIKGSRKSKFPATRMDQDRRRLFFFVGLLLLIVLVNLFAPFIAPHSPLKTQMSLRNALPSFTHIFGTDALGRDVFSRVMHGGRETIFISFSATFVSMSFGILLGYLSGWYGRWIDQSIQILMNIFQGLPGLSISVALVGVMGPSAFSIFIALILTGWSGVARLVRTQVRGLKQRQFVDSIRVYQAASWYIFTRHLLPLLLPSLVVLATNRMGRMILMVASLSFIGVGLRPPIPDWGVMVQDARSYFQAQPWSLLAPAFMICLTSFCLARCGECLRDYWDVHRQDNVE